jgi:hypothetical protein
LGQPGDDAADGTVIAGLLKKVPAGNSLELYLTGCDETVNPVAFTPITCTSTARTAAIRKSEILQGAVNALHGLA